MLDNGASVESAYSRHMAQDFAKQRPPQQQAARKGGKPTARRSSSHWSWFGSGIVAGMLLAVGGYLGFLHYQSLNPSNPETASQQAPAEQPDFDFGFYQELATAEVAVAVPADATTTVDGTAVANTPSTAAASPAAPQQPPAPNYLLQAGSFQDRQEADERRAKITLMNMATEIVPGVVAGRTWYRVQVGPFAGRDNAENARKELSANNIDSIPLLMR